MLFLSNLLHHRTRAHLLAAGIVLCFANGASADIVAKFKEGGNATTPVKKGDGWPSAPGAGWDIGWAVSSNSGIEVTPSVEDSPALTPGERHLELSVNNETGQNKTGGIHRRYLSDEGIQKNAPHTIQFTYRLDSDPSKIDRVRLFDAVSPALSESPESKTTWFLRGNGGPEGGMWVVYNENTQIRTGVPLKQGNIYRFSVTVHPSDSTYSVTIDDLTDRQTYTSKSPLKFRNPQTEVGGHLNFGATGSESTKFSIGDIQITPKL